MFIDALLLDKVAYGFAAGSEWLTLIAPLQNGHESRDGKRSRPKNHYICPYNNIDADNLALVRAAHNAAQGRLHTFRFFDRMDYQLTDQAIGIADGETDQEIQIVKTYAFGAASASRIVTKPVDAAVNYGRGERTLGPAPSFEVTADGVPISAGIDYTTGIVTLTGSIGEVIRVSGWFDINVRFNQDKLMFARGNRNAHSSDVELIEVWDDIEE